MRGVCARSVRRSVRGLCGGLCGGLCAANSQAQWPNRSEHRPVHKPRDGGLCEVCAEFNCKNLIEYYAMGPCPAGWICVHQSGVWWISSYLPYCQGRSTDGVCNLKHPLVGIEVCGKNHERVLNWFIPVTGARMSDVKQQTTREILRATVGYWGNLLLIQSGSLNTEICVSRWKTGCFFSWGCCRVPAQQSKALQRWILEGLP